MRKRVKLTRFITSTVVIIISARHADINQTRAGQCSSGLREKSLILTMSAVVHVPPASETMDSIATMIGSIFDFVRSLILQAKNS